uniref:Uncharacterized protein n=1 Tax=Arundo donax TaxID=35708 RepID=A0A0A9GFV2_ARUDO
MWSLILVISHSYGHYSFQGLPINMQILAEGTQILVSHYARLLYMF